MSQKPRSWKAGASVARRDFLAGSVGAAVALAAGRLRAEAPAVVGRAVKKIRIGIVGNGGRGSWIAKLFQQHGGYEIVSTGDYFPEVVQQCGEALGVPANRRFSGLNAYKRVIESGIDAVILKVPPCFFPEQAAAAVQAGLHVYMAKPVANDVPGCLTIERLGREAAAKNRVFFVDYQMPTDPQNQIVADAMKSGKLGQLARISTFGIGGGRPDPVKGPTIADRLRNLVWDNDMEIGGGFIVSYDVHAIDAAVWVLGRRPTSAVGFCRTFRPEPHGDSPDVFSVIYRYDDGLIHEHFSQALPNRVPGELSVKLYGYNAHAVINYWGNSWYEVRGEKRVEAEVANLYDNGALRNIAAFHELVTQGQCDSAIVARAVDGCLTCILGREAALRGEEVTMQQILEEKRSLAPNLTGLTA